METKTCFVYDTKEFSRFLEGIHVSPLMAAKPLCEPIPIPVTTENADQLPLDKLFKSDTLYCSYCCAGFLDKRQQRAHYKLDWHRYNLKQHLAQKKTISEDRFAQLADDVSSISGSENDSETETDVSTDVEASKDEARLTHLIARRSRALFNNSLGQVISVHRCLLLNKKEEAASEEHLVDLIRKLPNKVGWLVIMLGGGHFAAALFKGSEAIFHKTFHSYTVRAKQGGSQGTKDAKGAFSKSAGASLRRYNEQSFTQHVHDLLKAWAPDIVKCDFIFYRAVGPANSGILFNGTHAPLLRGDPRIRNIPFPTRRATFNEVQRVHSLLAKAYIYDSNEMFRTSFTTPAKEIQETEKKWSRSGDGSPKGSPRKIDRAKERPSPVRELPDIVQQLAAISTSGSEGDMFLLEEEISFVGSLKEYDDDVPQRVKNSMNKKKPTRRKKRETTSEGKEVIREEVQQLWTTIQGACQSQDLEVLKLALENTDGTVTKDEIFMILNQKNIMGETVLHSLAAESKGEEIRLLLLHGADPCIKDKKSQTPYDHAPDKVTRNIFRRFMGEHPEMYDYTKSHIPNALTDEIELEIAEKKRLSKKVKRQKDKERKAATEAMKRNENEKVRFLSLSDREKCALAAERRILSRSGKEGLQLTRCFQCASDMTGKVPFEYQSYKFCTMDCLKNHRTKSKQ